MKKQKEHVSAPARRPQEPIPPYPYQEEEVCYANNAASVTLCGTLTTPQTEGPFPTVILISGMGPNDRDYTTCGHKLFLVLADHLTRHGIAVLRVDKRGVGASTGICDMSVTSKDLAGDVLAGLTYLKTRTDINPEQIGLIGHSEGGMIAPMVAAQSKDVAFLVLMAGAVCTHANDVIEHTSLQLRADGASEELIKRDRILRKKVLECVTHEESATSEKLMREVVTHYWTMLPDTLKRESEKFLFAFTQENADAMIMMFNSTWYRFFLTHDAVDVLRHTTIPVLALNGDRDWITSSKKTLSVIAAALKEAGNRDYTTRELPKLNHQFRTCKTGSLQEYTMDGETIAPTVLNLITAWILGRTSDRTEKTAR